MASRILIVDDHFETAAILQEYFNELAIPADIATDGNGAVEMAGKTKYRCLITDVMLPDIDGVTVAAKIKATTRDIGIIFVTAKNLSQEAVYREHNFRCEVIQKPCKPSVLKKYVRKSLK